MTGVQTCALPICNIMAVENSAAETIIFTQIAGFVARRIIVSEKKVGEFVEQGERYGIIRFGSRCDIYVPLHYDLMVTKGQIAIGGETILAVNKATFSLEDLNWKKL